MPTPTKGESQQDFVSRCIPIVMDEGTAGDNKQAAAICFQMYRDHQKKQRQNMSAFLLDEYVATRPGEPYRLFKFGNIRKAGVTRELTPEVARRFRLPHFKPPIKLGSHKDETPAGGHIIALEVRADGLYAIPELTPSGSDVITQGAYRYHSPEVIWEDGGIENQDGEFIPGPLIVGDALLHTPHLGEAAALYTFEKHEKGETVMSDMVQVPTSLWERFLARFDKEPEKEPPKTTTEPDQFAAIEKERDEFKAKIATMEAEQRRKEELAALVTELQSDKFGAVFKKDAASAADVLIAMEEKTRAWVMQQFAALIAQIDESKLTGEIGTTGTDAAPDGVDAFNALVRAKMAALSIPYHEAYEIVRKEKPDVFKSAFSRKGGA